MNIYQSNKEQFSKDLLSINKKYTTISFLRLLSIVIFIGALYFHLQQTETVYIALEVLSFATFILLMRYHAKLSTKRKLTVSTRRQMLKEYSRPHGEPICRRTP